MACRLAPVFPAVILSALAVAACVRPLPVVSEQLTPAQLADHWQEENHGGLQALKDSNGARAEALLRKALSRTDRFPPQDPRRATTLNNLASALEMQGKDREAEDMYRQSLDAFESSVGVDHPAVETAAQNLARVACAESDWATAGLAYKRILNIQESTLGLSNPEFGKTLTDLAGIYIKQEKYSLAEPLYKRALAIDVKALGRDHPQSLQLLERYADLLRLMHRSGEADRLDALAKAVRAEKK